ncbi:alpha/beta-hydrolase, partial [Mycena filopes]
PPLSVTKFSVQTNTRGVPLTALGKRYQRTQAPTTPGITLLFAHGTGFNKEIWEPTIEALFDADHRHVIQEAWAVDGQNHGESAILNEARFKSGYLLDIWDYADALAIFRRDIIKQENVTVIGHSVGALGGVLMTSCFNPPDKIPLSSIILVEPPIFPKQLWMLHKTQMYSLVAEITAARRDVWPSFAAAKEWMQKRPPWASWAPEALDKYVAYGLRELPTWNLPDKRGVTLSCTKEHEALPYAYGDVEFDSLWRLNQICARLPVHIIWAGNDDLLQVSKELKESITDSTQGRTFASIGCVEGSGHMV